MVNFLSNWQFDRCFNSTHRDWMTHVYVGKPYWCVSWHVACSAWHYRLNQCWRIVNWIPSNELRWQLTCISKCLHNAPFSRNNLSSHAVVSGEYLYIYHCIFLDLTHWSLDKMAVILQTMSLNSFSSMIIILWILLIWVCLAITTTLKVWMTKNNIANICRNESVMGNSMHFSHFL